MPSIPRNNLKEQLLKLGYNPDQVRITAPKIDNSQIIKLPQASRVDIKPKAESISQVQPVANFKPPVISNIDDWSDFEDDFD